MSGLRRLRRDHSRKASLAAEKATRAIDARGARRFMIFVTGLGILFAVIMITLIVVAAR